MDENTMIGVDLAENIFSDSQRRNGWCSFIEKEASRDRFKEFMKSHEPALVVLEAFGSAHYWAETLGEMGHDVKLIAPQYVKTFVKRQKNDAADAEAIVVAAQRPECVLLKLKRKSSEQKLFYLEHASV